MGFGVDGWVQFGNGLASLFYKWVQVRLGSGWVQCWLRVRLEWVQFKDGFGC